jgi:predicted RNA-binding Zn ribbon-like protein
MTPAPTLYGASHQAHDLDRLPQPEVDRRDLCLAFVNTSAAHPGRTVSDDLAPGYANLLAWCLEAGIVSPDTALRLLRLAGKEPRDAAAVRRGALELRTATASLVRARVAGGEPDPATLARLESLLAGTARETGLVVQHDDTSAPWVTKGWKGGVRLDLLLWEIGQLIIAFLARPLSDPVRACERRGCDRVFLATHRGGNARYCSSTCGTAERVRRHRERKALEPPYDS